MYVLSKLWLFLLLLSLPQTLWAQWQVSVPQDDAIALAPTLTSGLEQVYVIPQTEGVRFVYQSKSTAPISAFRYTTSPLHDTHPITGTQTGSKFTLEGLKGGHGYYLVQQGKPLTYIWVINYQEVALELHRLQVNLERTDCYLTHFNLQRTSPPLYYHTINGQRIDIPRQVYLSYETQTWNESTHTFTSAQVVDTLITYEEFAIDTPLADTKFTLQGDQFLSHWQRAQSCESEPFSTSAIEGKTRVFRTEKPEEILTEPIIQGPAPLTLTLEASTTQPATSYVAWEVAADANFEEIEASYTLNPLEYTFDHEGAMFVRLVINNAQGSCPKEVAQYEIRTEESLLEVPNFFVPNARSESLQVFKVKSRSLITFEAIIYNRWGTPIFRWTDPAQGWDGTVKGKAAPAGAYYYLIRAKGAGGKEYNLKGNINLLNTIS